MPRVLKKNLPQLYLYDLLVTKFIRATNPPPDYLDPVAYERIDEDKLLQFYNDDALTVHVLEYVDETEQREMCELLKTLSSPVIASPQGLVIYFPLHEVVQRMEILGYRLMRHLADGPTLHQMVRENKRFRLLFRKGEEFVQINDDFNWDLKKRESLNVYRFKTDQTHFTKLKELFRFDTMMKDRYYHQKRFEIQDGFRIYSEPLGRIEHRADYVMPESPKYFVKQIQAFIEKGA